MEPLQILTALELISKGAALDAEVENELEEMGYIIQTHRPYATITAKGRGRMDRRPLKWVEGLTTPDGRIDLTHL
jgi:hypothetical protein